jgi:drug/metabolite transporter (DMT)-like permease
VNRTRVLAYVCFAIVCVVWGTTYLAIRFAVETIPPLLLTGIRYTAAGLVLFFISRFVKGEPVPRDRRVLADLAFVGFLMVGVGYLAVVIAELWVPSGMAALLVATAPFWMVLIEGMRGDGDRLERRGIIGMIAGFGGVALLLAPQGPDGRFDMKFLAGALIIQIGSIGWQYGTVRGKYGFKGVPFLTAAALQMLAGGLIVDIVGLAIGEASRFHVNMRTGLALAYLALFGSVIAYTAYVFATANLRTTKMSIYAYINPVVAVILGWLILHERLTMVSIVAMGIILGGVAIVQSAGLQKTRFFTREVRLPQFKKDAA